jgi:hypothetical protein
MNSKPNDDPWQPNVDLDAEARRRLIKQTIRHRRVDARLLREMASTSPSPKRVSETKDVAKVDGNATTLRDFAKHCHQIGLDQFLQRYPLNFLIQETELTKDLSSTAQTTTDGPDTQNSQPVDLFRALVYRLRKKTQSAQSIIIVGRSSNNDVFIDNKLISKFHAYFMVGGNRWHLADGGSTNGTFVDGVELKPNEPFLLQVNARISFSDASFRFVDNHRMLEYVKFFRLQGGA